MTTVDYGPDVEPGWDDLAGLADSGCYEGQPEFADVCAKCGAPGDAHDQSDEYASGCPVVPCSLPTPETSRSGQRLPLRDGVQSAGSEHRATETIFSVAVDALEVYGWCQNDYVGADGAMCLAGAIGRARDELRLSFGEAADAMSLVAVVCGQYVPEWNDTPGRTADEVKAVLWQAHEKTLAERGLL